MADKGVTVLFLGSGFSKAVGDIPIQDNFLPNILKGRYSWINKRGNGIPIPDKNLSEWMLQMKDVETCMSHFHNLAYSNLATCKTKHYAKMAIINLRAIIADYLQQKKMDVRSKIANAFCRKLLLKDDVVVLTTNYDLLLEKILDHRGRYYYYPAIFFQTAGARTRGIRFYKLHGSINWIEERRFDRHELIRVEDPPLLHNWGTRLRKLLPRNGYRVFVGRRNKKEIPFSPVMIPFFFQKEEWVGREARWAPVFKPHWRDAQEFLLRRKIKHFYFLGYALPFADHYMMTWLLNILVPKKPKITIVSKGDPRNLGKVLAPFNPTIYECGLEHFLEGHANL